MDGLRVTCQPGFDGGLPQSFLLEVRLGGGGREASGNAVLGGGGSGGGDVLSRTRSVRPDFVVSGLAPGTEYSIEVPCHLMDMPIHSLASNCTTCNRMFPS